MPHAPNEAQAQQQPGDHLCACCQVARFRKKVTQNALESQWIRQRGHKAGNGTREKNKHLANAKIGIDDSDISSIAHDISGFHAPGETVHQDSQVKSVNPN